MSRRSARNHASTARLSSQQPVTTTPSHPPVTNYPTVATTPNHPPVNPPVATTPSHPPVLNQTEDPPLDPQQGVDTSITSVTLQPTVDPSIDIQMRVDKSNTVDTSNLPSNIEPTPNPNTPVILGSISSNATEVYKDPTPTSSVKHLPSDLSYAMTNQSSSYACILPPGTMALAHGQVVHIISSSINEDNNTITYAVKVGNSIFITTSDQLTEIPTLSKESASTSSITISTKKS